MSHHSRRPHGLDQRGAWPRACPGRNFRIADAVEEGDDPRRASWASVAYGLFVIGYYVLLEGYLGQSLGKMVTGIKVVTEATGQTPGITAAAVRTVLRLIDGLFSYAVAFVTVLVSGKRQRLGDMAARTLVVRV